MPDPLSTARASALRAVPVEIRVCVGAARPTIAELLEMAPDAVLALDHRIEDPVELFVGDRLIARGELIEQEGATAGQLAVRLTEVMDGGDAG